VKSAAGAFSALFILILVSVFLFPPAAYGSSIFYISLFFTASALLLASWQAGKGKTLAYLGLSFKQKQLPMLALYGVLLAAVCVILSWIVSGIFYAFGALDTAPVLDKVSALPPLALLLAFTLAPLGEEMFFRGFLFRFAALRFSPKRNKGIIVWIASAVATSLIFAFLHWGYGSLAELAVAFIIGVALCASVKKAGSLVPAIVAHAIFNLLSVVMVSLY
jgi:membrane protease YdiL (CAAX protease family)